MSLRILLGPWLLFLYIACSEQRPTIEVTSLDGLEPGRLDRVPTDYMHPLDVLLCGGKIVDAVCLP